MPGVGERFELVGQLAHEAAQIKRLEDQVGAAAFDAGKVEEIVDEIEEVLGAFADEADGFFLFVVDGGRKRCRAAIQYNR